MIKDKFTSVGEYIYYKCSEGGNNIFLKELSTSNFYSYLKFWLEIERVVTYFDKIGIKTRDKIVLQMDNCVFSLAIFMGGLIANVVPIPVSTQIRGEELNSICERTNAVAVFTVADKVERLQFFSSIPVLDVQAHHDITPSKKFFEDINCLEDIAYIMFTSGSTGKSKEVAITHGNMLTEIESMAEAYMLDRSHRHLCVLPIYHASGLYRNILIPFSVGGEVVLSKKFDECNFWDVISNEQIHFVQVVPSILATLLMRSKEFKHGQQASLKYIGSASAPHPPELIKSFEEQFGVYVLQGYGMTEATCGITLMPFNQKDRKIGSVGKPLSVNKIEIWDESGEKLSNGEIGRVMVSGQNISITCLRTDDDKDKWFDTGDIGYLDKEGFLWLLGRESEFIKRGGYRVSPNEIENAISDSFSYLEVAVIGVAHPLLGQDIVAFVANSKGISSREIIRRIKGRIASYKIPSEILFIDYIPKLGLGKIDKEGLLSYYNDAKSNNCKKRED